MYKKDRSVIAKHLKRIYEKNDLKIDRTCAKNAQVQKEGNRLIKRIVDVYNLDAILKVGILVKSSNGLLLKEWFENYFASKKQELIEYNDGQIQLDVNIDPITETVWLSVNQMALLFETSPDNIYLHIKNIYSEGELFSSVTEESSATQKEIFQTAADGKSYLTTLYNLDVILSVGYRVKGKRAIEFRKWASRVLKQYLLKGYAIDKNRALVTNENYINLINEVSHLKDDVKEIQDIIKSKVRLSYICFEGNYFEGFSFVNSLIKQAKSRVIIIDGYADTSALDFFINSKKGIKKVIICAKKERIEEEFLFRFIKEYGEVSIKEDKSFHDRFLIIDKDIYQLGTSLNSLGNKTSYITKLDRCKVEEIYKVD